ncbi:MAG: restriction endonuclease [Chloroflexota bacterium]|nr:restriction endonuclease [Chloroflexota bacterium]
MSKTDDVFEKSVNAIVTRGSGRSVALFALAFHPGLGLVLPLALGWSVLNLASMNLFGFSMAAVLSLGWLGVQLQAKDRRHLVGWTTSLRLLNAEEFAWLVGELFRREGWIVREMGHQDRGDGNIDLELIKGADRRLVKCKPGRRGRSVSTTFAPSPELSFGRNCRAVAAYSSPCPTSLSRHGMRPREPG